jgi:hypothetical protein
MLIPSTNIEATLRHLLHRYGPAARLAVLPEGPQTVAHVAA